MNVIGNISEHLVQNNIKPSLQRIMIFEYLYERKNHPTVDEIYLEVHASIPTLSKTTVYNTLNLFLEAGIVIPVRIEGHELRYDQTVREHGHFMCNVCGRVVDFFYDADGLRYEGLENFVVREKGVYFRGLCPACAGNNF